MSIPSADKFPYAVARGTGANGELIIKTFANIDPSYLPGYDFLLLVEIPYPPDDYDFTIKLENRLETKLMALGAINIGHSLSPGRNKVAFRSKQSGPASVEIKTGLFKREQFAVVTYQDANWDEHAALFPLGQISDVTDGNEMLHKALNDAGDIATIPRNVDFCFFFRSADLRQQGLERLLTMGYFEMPEGMWEVDGSFGLVVTANTPVVPDVMTEHCLKLEALADEIGAEFDGWETEVRKS